MRVGAARPNPASCTKRILVIAITSRAQPSVLIIFTSTGRMCGAFDHMTTQTQPRHGGAFLPLLR
jgi:hypothetical protein